MIKLTGVEHIHDENGKNVATIQDFWMWAYSNLTDNTQRGAYAEYLVSLSTLLKLGARKVSFCEMNAAVLEAYLLSQKKGSN